MGIHFELFGREFAWLNNWYSVELAIAYYVWSTVAFLGVLQASAAWYDRSELAFSSNRVIGLVAGLVTWSAGVVGFYVTQYELIFVPGPATTEALVVLVTAALTAIMTTRGLVRLFALASAGRRQDTTRI